MESMSKIILIVVMALTSICVTAQNKKEKTKEKTKEEIKKNTKEVEEIEVTMDVPVVEEVAVDYQSTSYSRGTSAPIKLVSNIRYNNQYEIYGSITNDYDWFFDRYTSGERKYGIVNKAGDVILPNIFYKDYVQGNDVLIRLEERYGTYNLGTLKWGIPLEYELLMRMSNNNLFIAKKNGQYGVVDNNNVQIVPFEWASIESISGLENYIIVKSVSYQDKQYGIYSLIEKQLTIPCLYTSLYKLDKQNYFVVQNGSKVNIVDIQNSPRFKLWYDELNTVYDDADHYIVKQNDKYGVIDDNEKQVIPIEYMEIAKYQFSDGSHLARNKMGKYGFIRLDGTVTLPFEYDNLKKEYNSSIVSVQNGKCGLVQISSGIVREIVTCDFDDIKGINKVFVVEKNKMFGLLNELGKPITEINYQSIEMLNPNSGSNLIIKAKKDNSYWLLNQLGKPITNSKYDELSIVPNSVSYYYEMPRFTYMKAREKGGKYSLIDKVGMPITKPLFDDVVWEAQNLVTVKSKGKFGIYYILNQNLVVDFIYDQIVSTKNYFIGFAGSGMDLFQIESGKLILLESKK